MKPLSTSRSPRLAAVTAVLLASVMLTPAATAETLAEQLLNNRDLLDHPPASCDGKASLNTFEMQQCAAVAFKAEDAALNKIYGKAVAASSAKATSELRQAQRLWLQWREHQCLWESERYEGGTLQPVVFANCLVDTTKARVQQIEDALKP